MAVDTRDKRFSIMCLFAQVPRVHPNPDGAISAADRAQYNTLYRGITLGGGAGGASNQYLTLMGIGS